MPHANRSKQNIGNIRCSNPTPEQIKAIREKQVGLGQREFGQITCSTK